MSKHWRKLCFKDRTDYKSGSSETQEYSVAISDYTSTIAGILKAINRDDATALYDSLSGFFIYRTGAGIYHEMYKGGHHVRYWDNKYCLVRPNIEALFFDRLFDLTDILQALASHPNLKKVFFNTCERHTDISEKVFQPLKTTELDALRKEISMLREQCPTLAELATKLTSDLEGYPNSKDPVAQLEFKLRFLRTLHSHDQQLAQEKNYRCIIVNVSMILLGFIPNLIFGIVSGNFLFFKDTPKQARIAQIQSHVGLFKPASESPDMQRCPDENDAESSLTWPSGTYWYPG